MGILSGDFDREIRLGTVVRAIAPLCLEHRFDIHDACLIAEDALLATDMTTGTPSAAAIWLAMEMVEDRAASFAA